MEIDEKPNVLVVDDLDANIFYIQGILKHLEVNIITALSGQEALSKIQGIRVALALIDVNMPGMNGVELATIIHQDKTTDVIPIIFVTAHNCDELSLETFYDSGIIDFIQKPFKKKILLSKIGIFLELEKQKQRIYDSEKKYRTLINASPEGIVVMDVEGKINEISTIAAKLFGISDKYDFIGKDILTLFPVQEHDRIQKVINKTLTGGLTQNEEFHLNRADQSPFICEISINLIHGQDGSPKTFMAIIRDISKRKKIEQQLIHTERMAGLGEMATGIAHEINQPLNILSLSLENILYDLSTKKNIDENILQDRSKKIFDSIFRIGKIIDHIRYFSRDQQDYILSLFDVNESIINAQSMVSQQLRNKKIELIKKLDKKISPIIGNTYKFEQVILNLLLNAKDAIEEKEKLLNSNFKKIIEIVTTETGKHIFVDVSDNGIGIKEEELTKIMQPFYTTKESGRGTGLGLSISFGIIKEMSGNIEVSSEYKSGTKMRIILPVESIKNQAK